MADSPLDIDTNAAERALRVALGRKNFFFVGSDAGAERAAAIYSLLGSARLNDLDPKLYLRHVLTLIAEHPVNHIDGCYLGMYHSHPLRPVPIKGPHKLRGHLTLRFLTHATHIYGQHRTLTLLAYTANLQTSLIGWKPAQVRASSGERCGNRAIMCG